MNGWHRLWVLLMLCYGAVVGIGAFVRISAIQPSVGRQTILPFVDSETLRALKASSDKQAKDDADHLASEKAIGFVPDAGSDPNPFAQWAKPGVTTPVQTATPAPDDNPYSQWAQPADHLAREKATLDRQNAAIAASGKGESAALGQFDPSTAVPDDEYASEKRTVHGLAFDIPVNLKEEEKVKVADDLYLASTKEARGRKLVVIGWAVAVWLLPALLILGIGHGIGWVVRGFRKSHA